MILLFTCDTVLAFLQYQVSMLIDIVIHSYTVPMGLPNNIREWAEQVDKLKQTCKHERMVKKSWKNTEVKKHKSMSLKNSIGTIEGIFDDARTAKSWSTEFLDNIIQLPSILPGTCDGEIILDFWLLQLTDL
jgi:hypothetical protein